MENKLMKVLYIDDEKPALFNFQQLFHDDFDVITASSAALGMEILAQNEVPIVISDQRMPEKSGIEFLAEVAQLYPDTVRILLTAYSEAEIVIDAINKGQIYQYITKPFDSKNLKNILDKASQTWYLKRENVMLIAELKKKNEVLAQSEEKFRNIFENSIVGISITSVDGKLLVNDAFCNMLGYSIEEFADVNWRNITFKEDIEPNIKITNILLSGNKNSMRWEKRYLHKDGHIVWVDINTSLVRDENKNPLYFITAVVDITERKKAEESIKQSEEELRNLIELSPVAMSIIHDWKTVYFNPAAIKLFGAESQNELVNRHINSFIHEDYIELSIKNSKLLAEKGYIPIHEEKFIKLDGTILDVETQAKSIRFNDGPATLVVMNDITERKQQEYKININAKRLDALVNILQYSSDSVQDYLDYALSLVIEITESKIGYIYHYSEEKKEFVLNTWSKEVMHECRVKDQQTVYQLEKTGLWGEAVSQRKPIMVNDFQSNHPLKKGYPEEHAPLYRFLTVPVFYENKIVGVVGVANKQTDYVDEDTKQLTIMMDIVWKALEKKKSELALQNSEEKFKKSFYSSPDGITITRLSDGQFISVNPGYCEIFGYNENEIIGFKSTDLNLWINIEDRNKWVDQLLKDGEVINYEAKFKAKSGDIIDCLVSASIIELNDEKCILSQSRDITLRKRAEEALIKKNEDLDYMNKFMVNREVRMSEMKREVNELLERLGEEKRYL